MLEFNFDGKKREMVAERSAKRPLIVVGLSMENVDKGGDQRDAEMWNQRGAEMGKKVEKKTRGGRNAGDKGRALRESMNPDTDTSILAEEWSSLDW